MLSLAFETNIPSLVLLLPINYFAFSIIGTCIGVVLSIRTSENATLTTWLILRMVELLNIIFEVIIGVIVYCYISTTEGFVVLGFSTFHTICEIYAWNITKSMYFKDSLQNNVMLAVVNPFNEDDNIWFTDTNCGIENKYSGASGQGGRGPPRIVDL